MMFPGLRARILSRSSLLGLLCIVAVAFFVIESHQGGKPLPLYFCDTPSLVGINVVHETTTATVAFERNAPAHEIRFAIAGVLGIAADLVALQTSDGTGVSISGGSLQNNATYRVVKLTVEPFAAAMAASEAASASGVNFLPTLPRIPHVVFGALGTGRYRSLALNSLLSAKTFFGGDCRVSLHLMTDSVDGVPAEFNAVLVPYREWPDSGLSKFKDIRTALGSVLLQADYFYFLDADVHFKQQVQLADIAGDLVAVEHPMYPRHEWGWCAPGKLTICQYPYDRNPRSTAYIPPEFGKFIVNGVLTANSYYLQSAFWGGRSRFVLPLLDEIIPRIEADRAADIYSTIIQDERYLNWYFWKHGNDSDKSIRWLSSSYLYPAVPTGFGDWILRNNRPIIVHGVVNKPGKLIVGESEIRIGDSTLCLDLGMDPKIISYACHHTGGSQGFLLQNGTLKTTHVQRKCVDATRLSAGGVPVLARCNGMPSQIWRYDETTHQFINPALNLCLDVMQPSLKKHDVNIPVAVQPCVLGREQQRFAPHVIQLL